MPQSQRDLRRRHSRFLRQCDLKQCHLPCRLQFCLEAKFRIRGAHATSAPYHYQYHWPAKPLAVSPAMWRASAIVVCHLLTLLSLCRDMAIPTMLPGMPCIPVQSFRRLLDALSATIVLQHRVVARFPPYVVASHLVRETSCCSSAGTNCQLHDFYKVCTVATQITGCFGRRNRPNCAYGHWGSFCHTRKVLS